MKQIEPSVGPPQLAIILESPLWNPADEGLVKGLLLFFDGLALILPEANADRVIAASPLAQALFDSRLLRVIDPAEWMTPQVADAIQGTIISILDHDLLDTLPGYGGMSRFGENLTDSRDLQWGLREFLSRLRREELFYGWRNHGLYLDGRICMLAMLLATQACRVSISDVTLNPVSFRQGAEEGLDAVLRRRTTAHVGRMVLGDLAAVGIDFTEIPLQDLLDFRAEHGAQHRAYALAARRAALEISQADPAERPVLEALRIQELAAAAEELDSLRRQLLRPALATVFSVLGAAWTVKQGDPVGALIAAAGAVAALPNWPTAPEVSAYSYLVEAEGEFRARSAVRRR